MTDVRTHYDAARQYLRDGWYPMPLADGKKFPPPSGFTGYNRKPVTEDQVEQWSTQFHNVALGMPDNVIGIDVDTYQDKPGLDSLKRAEGYFGADLPDTWVSSSKDHATSGIRFYRVPDGVDWSTVASVLGDAVDGAPGVDIIRPTHRYAVVYPSVHPSGSRYTWVDPWGRECAPPRVDQLPELPATWMHGLTTRRASSNQGEPVTPEERTRTLASFPGGRSEKVDKNLATALGNQDSPVGSHYDAMVADTMSLVSLAVAGYSGVPEALDQLLARYVSRVAESRDRYTATGEFWRAVDGAIGKLWHAQPDAEKRSFRAPILATDLTIGDEYVDRYGDLVRFAIDQKRWLSYDAGKWDSLGGESIARRRVQEMVRDLWAYRLHTDSTGGTKREDATEWLHNSQRIGACLDQVRSMNGIQVIADDFNQGSTLLNVANGTVDLTSGMLHDHDSRDLITQRANVVYDPDAECPEFERFIREVLPDREVRGFVQRLFGMSLLGEVRDHVFTVFTGSGRNGKGVLTKIAQAVFGDYSTGINKELLVQTRNEGHLTMVATLYGRRLAIAQELDRGARWDVTRVKELTGGDRLTARRMYENEWTFTPSHTIIMTSNHRPSVGEGEGAFWARYREVPFTESFEGREDTTLADRIIDNELPGILQWMLRGLKEYLDHGLGSPDAVVAATREAREESDPLLRFIHERLRITGETSDVVGTREVYDAFTRWAATEGDHVKVGSYLRFGRELGRVTVTSEGPTVTSTVTLTPKKGTADPYKNISCVSGVTFKGSGESTVTVEPPTVTPELRSTVTVETPPDQGKHSKVTVVTVDPNKFSSTEESSEMKEEPRIERGTPDSTVTTVTSVTEDHSDLGDRVTESEYTGDTVATGLLSDGSVSPDYKIVQGQELGQEVVSYAEWVRRMKLAGKWVDPTPGFTWSPVDLEGEAA